LDASIVGRARAAEEVSRRDREHRVIAPLGDEGHDLEVQIRERRPFGQPIDVIAAALLLVALRARRGGAASEALDLRLREGTRTLAVIARIARREPYARGFSEQAAQRTLVAVVVEVAALAVAIAEPPSARTSSIGPSRTPRKRRAKCPNCRPMTFSCVPCAPLRVMMWMTPPTALSPHTALAGPRTISMRSTSSSRSQLQSGVLESASLIAGRPQHERADPLPPPLLKPRA
jgi:hypothetical protein